MTAGTVTASTPDPTDRPDRTGARLEAGGEVPAGVPDGWREAATSHWRVAACWADRAGLRPRTLDDTALADRLTAELTAPLRLEDWPRPKPPRPVGGGWIHDEVADEDRTAFEEWLATWADEWTGGGPPIEDGAGRSRGAPEAVARAAQEMRWPVTPYRSLPRRAPAEPSPVIRSPHRPAPSRQDPSFPVSRPAAPVVVDLTTHWAGPLAGALLAEAGARVVKIDPDCRPDGFRSRSDLHAHLNGAKESLDLDLRVETDRTSFERLVAGADLIIESFSRRVLPNLGYEAGTLQRLNPGLAMVSLRAFPLGTPEADWLAYGPGVHAASGLGWSRPIRKAGAGLAEPEPAPAPTPVAYPDLVAGVAAYGTAVALLGGWLPIDHGSRRPIAWCEVTLADSVEPLVSRAVAQSDRDGKSPHD